MNSLSASISRRLPRRVALTLGAAVVLLSVSTFAQEKAKAPAGSAAGATEQKYKTNVKGPADAPIQVVEFADFMCPGCQAASNALRAYFAQQGPDINLTFKNFPLEKTCNPGLGQTIHNGACDLALGSICASELGVFWAYHDRIFSRAWEVATRQDVIDNGVAVGMNKAKLEACLASPEARSKLAIQVKEGFETMVQVTPTLVVNGKKLSATNQFASVVEEERKKLAAVQTK
ncbi:MAG: thioredoxin domain-containing protein [Vicinamibacteria bacterium]|nr:thioredoxin domain-containing protein [Vicinamibacteria bacterium]